MFWIGVLMLAVVAAAFSILWGQGRELAVGLFVAPLGFGLVLAIGLTLVGWVYRRR